MAALLLQPLRAAHRGGIHGTIMATWATTAARSNYPMKHLPQQLVVVARQYKMYFLNNGKVSMLLISAVKIIRSPSRALFVQYWQDSITSLLRLIVPQDY